MPDDGGLFPPGRDHRPARRRPIPENVDSAVDHEPTHMRASDLHLLRDCLALGKPAYRRPPAKVRLEEALGPELTRRLLRSLSAAKRP
jgi:hypothetical protein